MTVHSVKMQISSRIDLQLFCQVNDSEMYASQTQRVEQVERVASFNEEKFIIDLAPLRGRNESSLHNKSNLITLNESVSEMSMMTEQND